MPRRKNIIEAFCMNSNNQCLRTTMRDFAIVAWILTSEKKACDLDLLHSTHNLYEEGRKYLEDARRLLYENRMNQELLYLDQVEGLYLEMLRNYCLNSFISTIIIARILTEYLLDIVYNILLSNSLKISINTVRMETKITCIRMIYGRKVEAFLKHLQNIRENANNYLHQVEKQGKIIPKREEINKLIRDLIHKILTNAEQSDILALEKEIKPCTPSKDEAKEIIDKTNKLLNEFTNAISFLFSNIKNIK